MKTILQTISALGLFVLSLTACNTGKDQAKQADSSYTMEEKLELARLAALEESGYEVVYEFKEGKAIVYFSDSVGFINPQGKLTAVPGVKEMQNFSLGLSAGKTSDGIACFIDSTGKIVKTFPDYNSVYNFEADGITNFYHKNDKFGLLDRSFKELIPAKYNQTSFYSAGIYIVETGGKWGAVDKTDKTIIPFEYQTLGMMDESGMIMATNANGSGYIDKTGKIMIPLHFYNLFPFQENFAKFIDKTSGNYGIIDRTGKMVVQPKYSDIQFFKNGRAAVSSYTYVKDGETIIKKGYIDTTGKEVIPMTFTSASDFDKRGYALVQDSLGDAYIDRMGKKIQLKINSMISQMGIFENGFAKISLSDGQNVYLDGYQRVLTREDLIRLRGEFFK